MVMAEGILSFSIHKQMQMRLSCPASNLSLFFGTFFFLSILTIHQEKESL